MAATEPTVVGGIMTFVFYCALPLSLLFYISGARRRRVRRQATPNARRSNARNDRPDGGDVALGDGDGDGD
jgi:hypothetical protein